MQKCGVPSGRLTDRAVAGRIVAVVAAIVVLLIFVFQWGAGGRGNREPPSPGAPRKVWNPTVEERTERDRWIAQSQQRRIFGDILVRNRIGRVVVGPVFYMADFKQKQTMASVAMAWCLDRDPDCIVLVLEDWSTGKEVGKWGDVYGGLEMK